LERRLGRGLGSLLGGGPAATPDVDSQQNGNGLPRQIPLIDIRPNANQPRKVFAADGLQELRDSIRQHGVLQPIVLRRVKEGYELIAGERRWRACRLAGLSEVPAVVRTDVSDELMLELALVENVQRRDLNALEKAEGYRNMMTQLSLTQEQVAIKVGLKRATVANQLRLLELPETVGLALTENLISMGHARAILAANGVEQQEEFLAITVRDGLSVRALEALIKGQNAASDLIPSQGAVTGSLEATSSEPTSRVEESWVTEIQRRIQIVLGCKVTIANREGYRGKIVLEYHGRDDLERLIEALAPKEEL
jgi:ParB family chromosome partitioning protein